MGTNVIQMTDPAFMLELRDRVWNDFDTSLTKRIKERKVIISVDSCTFVSKPKGLSNKKSLC